MEMTIYTTTKSWSYESNGLSITALNLRDIYYRLEALAKSLCKTYRKYNGLDLDYLSNSSTLKSITRDVRNYCQKHWGEVWTMEEDRTARRHLAAYLLDTVCELIEEN